MTRKAHLTLPLTLTLPVTLTINLILTPTITSTITLSKHLKHVKSQGPHKKTVNVSYNIRSTENLQIMIPPNHQQKQALSNLGSCAGRIASRLRRREFNSQPAELNSQPAEL